MEEKNLHRFWPLIHSIIQTIWAITEKHIEEAAIRKNIPIELYYYSELGMDSFSVDEFQKRDPFSNPEQFEKQFASLEIRDWITPTYEDGRFQVRERARDAVRQIMEAGNTQLLELETTSAEYLERLLAFLKQIVLASSFAPEPPHKWAIVNRFHVANANSPVIVQIRECLMDLFAYRDDAHLSAARPYFSEAGIVWNAFNSVWSGSAVTAGKIAEALVFRGYAMEDYAAALQAATEAGWVESADAPHTFRPTPKGREMHEQVEKLTNEYFYRPWAMFSQNELDEIYDLLKHLREQLHGVKKLV